MGKDNNLKKIDNIIDEAKANVEFAKGYLATGNADFENAPRSIAASKKIIATSISSVAGAGLVGGLAASAVGTGIATGGGALATSAFGLTIGGVALTPIAPLLTPVLLGGAIGASLVGKNYLKKRKNEINQHKSDVDQCIDLLKEKYENNSLNALKNVEKYQTTIDKVIKDFKEKVKEVGKKAAITLDDALNINVNKRIKEYQEIVLKQYERQNELDKKLYDVA